MHNRRQLMLYTVLWAGLSQLATADENTVVHGLWVWKTQSVLDAAQAAQKLQDSCRSEDINEVYVSVPVHVDVSLQGRLSQVIALLHQSNIRVEALLSSIDADEPGQPRQKLVAHVRQIVQFNRNHGGSQFDGIHLDIEPQQREENKRPGNLRFLSDLVDTYRAVSTEAGNAGLQVNADIQTKVLKSSLAQRKMLLSSLPRLTLMLYEVSGVGDTSSTAQKIEKLRATSQKFLDLAYSGLSGPGLAQMIVALRTPDYGELMPQMLKTLDLANHGNSHYGGWAWHSYNDQLSSAVGMHEVRATLAPLLGY